MPALGDVVEGAWKVLGPFGHLLQKMAIPHRQLWLELIIERYNITKEGELAAMLKRMYMRAWLAEDNETDSFKSLYLEMLAANISTAPMPQDFHMIT